MMQLKYVPAIKFIMTNNLKSHMLGNFFIYLLLYITEVVWQLICLQIQCILIRGTASDVFGIESETWFRKTVRLSRTVTSETGIHYEM